MSNPQNSKSEDELLWIFIGIAVALGAAWYFGHEKISIFVMKVRLFESHLLIFDPEARDAILEWLATTHPKDATLKDYFMSGVVAARSLRYVVALIITGIFGYLVYSSPDRSDRYCKVYTTETLAEQESAIWKVIQPVLGRHFEDVPLDDPINGMRTRPRDYGRKHKFIVRISSLGDQINDVDVVQLDHKDALLITRARAIFAKQLGRPWQGIQSLRQYERCLFAAFAAQMNNDLKLAQDIIDDLAVAFCRARAKKDIKQINSLRAQAALYKYGNTSAVQKICAGHYYVSTVLLSMLHIEKGARKNGILPPNWFRWLKEVDRVLWYGLNDLGLDVASVEAAGIRSHWMTETFARRPIAEPRIENAIVGFREALEEFCDEEVED